MSLSKTPQPVYSGSYQVLPSTNSSMFRPLSRINFIVAALSIANLGLISSMVAFLHEQKDNVHSYKINWPSGPVQLNVEPAQLWTDQGHASNGVAGYGFFLGLFGIYIACRQRGQAKRTSKSLMTLLVLQCLAVVFTFSALIFVFVVTYQTRDQTISQSIAQSNEGSNYPAMKWTPETWYEAVLKLPLAEHSQHDEIASRVVSMLAWRWMLIPILVADVIALGVTVVAVLKQRQGHGGYGEMVEQHVGLMPGSTPMAETRSGGRWERVHLMGR